MTICEALVGMAICVYIVKLLFFVNEKKIASVSDSLYWCFYYKKRTELFSTLALFCSHQIHLLDY